MIISKHMVRRGLPNNTFLFKYYNQHHLSSLVSDSTSCLSCQTSSVALHLHTVTSLFHHNQAVEHESCSLLWMRNYDNTSFHSCACTYYQFCQTYLAGLSS